LAAQLLDALLVDAFDNDTADHGARDRGIAEPFPHRGLDVGSGGIQKSVSDPVAREDVSHLLAIRAPGGAVENDALAASGLCRGRQKKERQGRDGGNETALEGGNRCWHCSPRNLAQPIYMRHIVRATIVVTIEQLEDHWIFDLYRC
jgi:hypothetical protein